MTGRAGSLRERLRAETAGAHAALEAAFGFERVLHDRAHVGRLLVALHGFFAELEPALDSALGPVLMAGRHRLPDLASDLLALDLQPEPASGPARRDMLPGRDGRDTMLGALYVTEGARLGGRVIGRAASAEAWYPETGLRFWRDDPTTGERWRSFLAALDTASSPDAVVRGANGTFDALRAAFDAGGTTEPPSSDAGRPRAARSGQAGASA